MSTVRASGQNSRISPFGPYSCRTVVCDIVQRRVSPTRRGAGTETRLPRAWRLFAGTGTVVGRRADRGRVRCLLVVGRGDRFCMLVTVCQVRAPGACGDRDRASEEEQEVVAAAVMVWWWGGGAATLTLPRRAGALRSAVGVRRGEVVWCGAAPPCRGDGGAPARAPWTSRFQSAPLCRGDDLAAYLGSLPVEFQYAPLCRGDQLRTHDGLSGPVSIRAPV